MDGFVFAHLIDESCSYNELIVYGIISKLGVLFCVIIVLLDDIIRFEKKLFITYVDFCFPCILINISNSIIKSLNLNSNASARF